MMRFLLLAVLLIPLSSHAQERAVGGSLQTEASWSALHSRINKTDGDVTVVRTDVNAIKNCATQGKLYTPGVNGGCSPAAVDLSGLQSQINTLNNQMKNVINCGAQGMTFTGSGCRRVSAPTCSLDARTVTNRCRSIGYPDCPSGYTSISTDSRSCGSHGDYSEYSRFCLKVTCQ